MAKSSGSLDRRLGALAGSSHSGQRTLADRAFASLQEAVLGGVLLPGERLPIEDIAAALGMSPMPVREALRRLDSVGLVEHVPHRGARVSELSLKDLTEVYEARLALEVLAVRRAAECGDEEQLGAAAAALAELGRGGARAKERGWAAHTAFHCALYRASGSSWLVRLIQPLWESSERYRRSQATRGRFDLRPGEHEEILAATVARQAPRAAALMHNHLATTANSLAAQMGEEHELFPLVRVPAGARARAKRTK